MVPFNTASLSEQAEVALKEEILSGRLAPAERINLGKYAADWKLSPTPLRDAVRQLEAQGFVEVSPRRGVFVATIDRTALIEIFQLRIALECLAVELATPRIPLHEAQDVRDRYLAARDAATPQERAAMLAEIDHLIHALVVRHTGNARLTRIMDGLHDLIRWSRWTSFAQARVPYEAALPEHVRIAEAICRRDTAGAARAMREHLENTIDRIERELGPAAATAYGHDEVAPDTAGRGSTRAFRQAPPARRTRRHRQEQQQ